MTAPEPNAQLLAIVEVDKPERVVCQAPGCGHGVHRAIHVVREGGRLGVYGSDCFARLFKGLVAPPRYGSGEGRELTPEERRMLSENTERLIAQFEAQHQQQLEQARAAAMRAEASRLEAERRRLPTAAEIASVEYRAKAIVRERYGVDNPDAPGWRGLVLKHASELLGK